MSYTVELLSLSKIGRLLKERLGDNASQYLFPDDFEKAIVDIGFSGIVIDGDSSPYDEIIFLGNSSEKISRHNGAYVYTRLSQKATFIGATYIAPYILRSQTALIDVVLNDGITEIGEQAFAYTSSLSKNITLPSSVTTLRKNVFYGSGITGIIAPSVTSIELSASNNMGTLGGCPNLKTVSLPKNVSYNSSTNSRGLFINDTSLETVTLGSVGYAVTTISEYTFTGCTSAFTLTVYCAGTNVSTLLTNIRSSAANATVIFKASADTTYNGNSYSAGDTMLTSTPS